MRIAYITAGAGGMYCGSCLRDNTLARELNRLGHPTVLVPTYTPLRTDEEDASVRRVFYGGIGVYLAQRFGFLRRRVPFLDRALSSRVLLRAAAGLGLKTEAAALGELAVSVLRGEEGNQKKALDELVEYLEWEVKPDLVHLTNSLFAGLAPALKRRLRVPVVCAFQGEDLFLDGLHEAHRREALGLIRKAAAAIDGFVAVSGFTADLMAGAVGIARERIRVIHPGLRLDGFPQAPKPAAGPGGPLTVGYFARIAPEKGLAVLAEAYRVLRAAPGSSGPGGADGTGPPPRLLAAGTMGRSERRYLASIEERLEAAGLADGFRYLGETDRAGKIDFLRRADVLSVPAPYPEAMGLFVYESLACGTPVVLPRSGAFSEIVEATGGGILVEPGDPAALAAGIRRLLHDPTLRAELGLRGFEAVRARFTAEAMARAAIRAYDELLAARR